MLGALASPRPLATLLAHGIIFLRIFRECFPSRLECTSFAVREVYDPRHNGALMMMIAPLLFMTVRRGFRGGKRREIEERQAKQELRRHARTLPQIHLGQGSWMRLKFKLSLNRVHLERSGARSFRWNQQNFKFPFQSKVMIKQYWRKKIAALPKSAKLTSIQITRKNVGESSGVHQI